jgi:hypothetical protein
MLAPYIADRQGEADRGNAERGDERETAPTKKGAEDAWTSPRN